MRSHLFVPSFGPCRQVQGDRGEVLPPKEGPRGDTHLRAREEGRQGAWGGGSTRRSLGEMAFRGRGGGGAGCCNRSSWFPFRFRTFWFAFFGCFLFLPLSKGILQKEEGLLERGGIMGGII